MAKKGRPKGSKNGVKKIQKTPKTAEELRNFWLHLSFSEKQVLRAITEFE